MAVGIVVDSAASLPAHVARDLGIVVAPMTLRLGDREVEDRLEDIGDVITSLEGPVSTSAPSPGRFAESIAAADQGDGVVVVTVVATMSATHDAARVAAGLHQGNVVVLDSGTAAGGEGLVAVAAAECARTGAPLADVAAHGRAVAARVRLRATIGDLHHLARSGRVPAAAAWATEWFNMHPVFEFRRGRVVPGRPALSRGAAVTNIVAACARGGTPGAALHVAALYTVDAAAGEELLGRVRDRTGVVPATELLAPFSAVMVAHTGPQLAGLAWWWNLSALS